jgi:Family of unknown function (DUF5701)
VAVDGADSDNALLVMHPHHAPASQLVPLIGHNSKHGFLVVDMPDVDDFAPIASVRLSAGPLYLINRLDRCDHMANWSPDEALRAITAAGRTPLSHWLMQQPEMLQRNHCFMTIGSRLPKPNGSLNARTPALWINNGTGCDGPDNRDAPQSQMVLGRRPAHWLGFASATTRAELPHAAQSGSPGDRTPGSYRTGYVEFNITGCPMYGMLTTCLPGWVFRCCVRVCRIDCST